LNQHKGVKGSAYHLVNLNAWGKFNENSSRCLRFIEWALWRWKHCRISYEWIQSLCGHLRLFYLLFFKATKKKNSNVKADGMNDIKENKLLM
jgi:hypothetical protein